MAKSKSIAKKADKERLARIAEEKQVVRDALFSMKHIYTLHEEICSIRLKYGVDAPDAEEVRQIRLDCLKETGFYEEDVDILRGQMLAQTETLKQGIGQLLGLAMQSGRVSHFVSLGRLLLDTVQVQAKLFGVDSENVKALPQAISVQFEEMQSLD